MIDVKKMIIDKYPQLKDNKTINRAIFKLSDSVVHQKEINNFLHYHNETIF